MSDWSPAGHSWLRTLKFIGHLTAPACQVPGCGVTKAVTQPGYPGYLVRQDRSQGSAPRQFYQKRPVLNVVSGALFEKEQKSVFLKLRKVFKRRLETQRFLIKL